MGVGLILIAIFAIFAIVIVGLIVYFVGVHNNLVALKNDIDRSFANIDVILKQRHDELPKLVDTCKGYMQYEQKTLLAVTDARTSYMRATTPAEKAQADGMVSGALKTLFAVAENYPDLKADANFIQLQGRITDLEEKIAAQRSVFNATANNFNIRIAQIPANFVAGFMGLQPHVLFQAAEADREDVKISFT
jgi:LemA protein